MMYLTVLQCPVEAEIPYATIINNAAYVGQTIDVVCDKGYGIFRDSPYINSTCLPSQEYDLNLTNIQCQSESIINAWSLLKQSAA